MNPENPRGEAAQNKQIGIIILAAGASRRMNEPKQLLEFEGKTLLRRAVETALAAAGDETIVVLGANFEKTAGEIDNLPVEIVRNENWESGLSASIKAGIDRLTEILPLAGALIMLVDQPFITAKQLDLFAEKYRAPQFDRLIIASEYNQTLGVPALFSVAVFDDLRKLAGDEGAKAVIKKHHSSVSAVNLPEAAFDIDTPQDFLNYLTQRR